MGTKGLVGITVLEKKCWTYNHYDSYPEELGENVVFFCNETTDKKEGWDKLRNHALKVKMVESNAQAPKELRAIYSKNGIDWYDVLRDYQGVDGLYELYEGTLGHMIDSREFLEDSSCEYAYIINLNNMELEVYKNSKQVGCFTLHQKIPPHWSACFE